MLTYAALAPCPDLKQVFRDINDYLYANTDLARKEKQGAEVLRILFCKLTDELNGQAAPASPCVFQYLPGESAAALTKRLAGLTTGRGKAAEPAPGQQLSASALKYIITRLQAISLLTTSENAVAEAFQIFSERLFASDKGQFFTPARVIAMILTMFAPPPTARIIDPACGVGGFLTQAWRYLAAQHPGHARRAEFCGVDKESDLARIAQLYLNLLRRATDSAIVQGDSLQLFAQGKLPADHFDYVLTNPPFGTKLKIVDAALLQHYALGHEWKFREEGGWHQTTAVRPTAPQILFIELCVRLLKPGGRLGIVLPDGVLGNKSDGYIRQWLQTQGAVLGVVDCPTATFMPYTGTKTSVVLFEKAGRPRPVFLAIAENCGHTMRGKAVTTTQGTTEDFTQIAENFRMHRTDTHRGFTVPALHEDIWVPRFYDPRVTGQLQRLAAQKITRPVTLGALMAAGAIVVNNIPATVKSEDYVPNGPIRFIRTSDLEALALARQTQKTVAAASYARHRARQDLQINDILFVKDGDNKIGQTALLARPDDLEVVVQAHFLKIRCTDFNPYLMLWLLNTPLVKAQIRLLVFNQSTLSTIGGRFADLVLPRPAAAAQEQKLIALAEKFVHTRHALTTTWESSYELFIAPGRKSKT